MNERETTIDRAEDVESRLTRLWERNLGVEVRNDDDYFKVGGDSLRGAQLLTWVGEELGAELSLLDLFESRTVAAQARLIAGRLSAVNPLPERPWTEFRFFGPADGQLFGALHRPASTRADTGVVLCYPIGQEYMRIHRSYVELARALAAAGLPTMRFDYYGCGDSAGESTAGDLERWVRDAGSAVDELRAATGVRNVHLVGARVGANLAMRACASRDEIAGLVLWEPVVNGAEYVAALRRSHRDMLASNAELDGYELRERPDGVVAEIAGFAFSRRLFDQLLAIDLTVPCAERLPDALVVANSDKPALRELVAARSNGAAKLGYVVAGESDGIWLKEDRQNKGLIPARAIGAIVSWIREKTA